MSTAISPSSQPRKPAEENPAMFGVRRPGQRNLTQQFIRWMLLFLVAAILMVIADHLHVVPHRFQFPAFEV